MASTRLAASTLQAITRLARVNQHLTLKPTASRLPFSTSSIMPTADENHKDGSMNFASKDGSFKRQESSFRDAISTEKGAKFTPELNRYHLVTAMACPWAHRAMIVRVLKGIDKVEGLLPLHTVDSILGPEGWSFVPYDTGDLKGHGIPGTGIKIPGHEDKKRIRDLYFTADPKYNARCTVPIIWDNKQNTIVSNESSEIIRFMNTCFDEFLPKDKQGLTFYPDKDEPKLCKEIDGLNEWIYPYVNNGVYRSGFASAQKAYEEAVKPLFEHLDKLENILSDGRKYLVGGRLTEADIRLYTTIVRFDPVYATHFRCNLRTIRAGYPNIHRWLRQLYWTDERSAAFRDTTDFPSIKSHYYESHTQINPYRIVPFGPVPHILPMEA